MWIFNKKPNPSDTSKIDDINYTEVKSVSDKAQNEINQASYEANESTMIEGMTRYLKDKGYDVTPSGTPVKNLFGKITNTGEDAFYIGRGVARKVKSNISDKLNELKNIGL
jgi:hypothetical protein